MKPKCENCKHHKLIEATPNCPRVICTDDGEHIERWYRCDKWEPEDKEDDNR